MIRTRKTMYRFLNFKGFADAGLNLFRPLTVLIGPNGSGKSNAIEAVELFSFVTRGKMLHEVGDIGSGADFEVRGGLQGCARHGKTSFGFHFSGNIMFEGTARPFDYAIDLAVKPKVRITNEKFSFTDEDTLIFKTYGLREATLAGDIAVEYNNFARGKNPKARVSSSHSVISQYAEFATANRHLESCLSVTNGIARFVRSSFAFNPIPNLMRGYERIGAGAAPLSRTGANLSSVLYALSRDRNGGSQKLARLQGWIGQLPEQPLDKLEFVTTSIGDVIFGLRATDGELVDARLLSDGTLRALAILTALETVEEGSRVIIEEFDNGVHPSRVRVLTEAMADCCVRRRLNVLVTTHNPATLNALTPPQLSGVVFCVWDAETKAYQLVELNALPRRTEFLQRGRLGDLVTRKLVEEYLAPRFDESRKQEAIAWLETLE